jgi:hypothetical protein
LDPEKVRQKLKEKLNLFVNFSFFYALDVLRMAGGFAHRLKVFYEGQNKYSAIFIPPRI